MPNQANVATGSNRILRTLAIPAVFSGETAAAEMMKPSCAIA